MAGYEHKRRVTKKVSKNNVQHEADKTSTEKVGNQS